MTLHSWILEHASPTARTVPYKSQYHLCTRRLPVWFTVIRNADGGLFKEHKDGSVLGKSMNFIIVTKESRKPYLSANAAEVLEKIP